MSRLAMLLLLLSCGCAGDAAWTIPAAVGPRTLLASRLTVRAVTIEDYLGDREQAEAEAREAGFESLAELLRATIEERLQAAAGGDSPALEIEVAFSVLADRWLPTPWYALVPLGFLYVPLGQRLVEAEAVFLTQRGERSLDVPLRLQRTRATEGLVYGTGKSPGERLGELVDRYLDQLEQRLAE